ncbi:MAG: PIG-L family deacetylase, partial [Nitrospira sp.]|nr:PIG-L family deacetylase [Nitrospira sp.]
WARTTHLCIAAHPDDVEVMALDGILACFGRRDRWFSAVVVTDGAGSPRAGLYASYTDPEMRAVRRHEQKKAACVGEYSAVAFLNHASATVKNPADPSAGNDLQTLLGRCRPEVVYTHNPADKHDTHVAVLLRALGAIRALPGERRPEHLYGCEVWRDLDWLEDRDKVVFCLDRHENIAAALLGVFDSQIAGGKRYDLAVTGRRQAHATFHESHSVDRSRLASFAIDLTPLIREDTDLARYVGERIRRFADDVLARIARLA